MKSSLSLLLDFAGQAGQFSARTPLLRSHTVGCFFFPAGISRRVHVIIPSIYCNHVISFIQRDLSKWRSLVSVFVSGLGSSVHRFPDFLTLYWQRYNELQMSDGDPLSYPSLYYSLLPMNLFTSGMLPSQLYVKLKWNKLLSSNWEYSYLFFKWWIISNWCGKS